MAREVIAVVILLYACNGTAFHDYGGDHCYPTLKDPRNGRITYYPPETPRGENTIATFTCNEGYWLFGESTLVCQSDGYWSETSPYCVGPFQNEPPPVYLSLGSTTYTTNNSLISITEIGEDAGSYPRLSCHTDLIACCRNSDTGGQGGLGEWYYPNETVVPNQAALVDFYRVRNTPQAIRLSRRRARATGPTGPTGLYCCVIPTSVGEQRFCAYLLSVLCAPLSTPNHGQLKYNYSEGRDLVATYSCDEGYLLIGESTLTCQSDGSWSSMAPYCASICPSLPTPTNGMISYNPMDSPNLQDTVATYSCDEGYVLIGESILTCQSDRTWSSIAPYCADQAIVQLKFGPTEHCIYDWSANKASMMSSLIRQSLQEAIQKEGNLTIPLDHIEEGFFSCYNHKNHTTFRTNIIGTDVARADKAAVYIQKWVESGAAIRVLWYILFFDKNCPVNISSLSESECGEDEEVQRCVDICRARG